MHRSVSESGKCFEEKSCRSPVSRILSIPLARNCTVISLTPPERSAPLARSATNTRRLTGGQPFPCSVLHHAGFAMPLRLPSARWALTPPFHPYLCPCGPSAVCFLLHFPSGSLAVPVPHFHGARCPVVSGLSSTPACAKVATVRGAARERMPSIAMMSKEKMPPQTRDAPTRRHFTRSKRHRGKTKGSSPDQRRA